MRILYLASYFEPEQTAFTHLERDLLEGLVEAGHKIEVICPTPTRGVSANIITEYKRRKKEELYNGSVKVTRFFSPQERKSPLIRALRYFWCNLRTYQIGKSFSNIDVVFANSTPPTQGWIAGRVAKKICAPLVYSLQDVFPDSLVKTGLTKEGSLLWNIGRRLEKTTYEHSNAIIVISNSMKDNLREKGVKEKTLFVVTNWVDTEDIKPVSRVSNNLFDEFGIDRNKYIVLYAGNFGSAQGAEIVLNVAKELSNRDEIQFVIFGGGAGYENAKKKASSLNNVFIHPLLPQERISDVYSMGDVALITNKKGFGKTGMPSKTWSIMACNTPIIAAIDLNSELASIINKNKVGICVEPEDTNMIISGIFSLINGYKIVGGREYVEEYCSRNVCVNQYIKILEEQLD